MSHAADRVFGYCDLLAGRLRNYASQYQALNALTDLKARADAEKNLMFSPRNEARSMAASDFESDIGLCLESKTFDRTELGKRSDRMSNAVAALVLGGDDTTSIQAALDGLVKVMTEINALPIDEE